MIRIAQSIKITRISLLKKLSANVTSFGFWQYDKFVFKLLLLFQGKKMILLPHLLDWLFKTPNAVENTRKHYTGRSYNTRIHELKRQTDWSTLR